MDASPGKGHQSHSRRHECIFAVCERHFRPTVAQQVPLAVVSCVRGASRNGIMWVSCSAVFALTNAAYTPFMKTALMIVS